MAAAEVDGAASWRRAVGRIAVGFVAAYALYLVAANLALNSTLARELANSQPQKFVASWGSAWTLYPGHFRVRQVQLAGHVRRTVWSLQADDARGRIALWPLLARELRIPRVVALGVSGGASLIDTVRPPPPYAPGGWTVRFDRIEAQSIRQAYFEDLVVRGDGRAVVGFTKVLRGGPMAVLPSTAELERATAWLDGAEVARDATVAARFEVARHRYEEAPGIRKLEKTDLVLDLAATTAGVAVRPGGEHPATLARTDGPGRLQGRLAWNSGAFAPGGTLQLVLPVRSEFDGTPRATEATAELRIESDAIRLAAALMPLHDDSLHVSSELTVAGRTVPVADPGALVQRTSGYVRGDWHFESLAWLASLLPPAVPVGFDGAGVVRGDVELRDGVAVAGSFVEAPRVAATVTALGSRFAGKARARIALEPAAEGATATRLQATLEQFTIARLDDVAAPYVEGNDLRVDARSTASTAAELGEHVHGRVTFAGARVPDVRVYNRYLPRTPLRLVGGSARLDGDLRFDRTGGVASGRIALAGREVEAAMAELAIHGDLAVEMRVNRAELATRRFDAAGSRVRLERARVDAAGESVATDWWWEIELDDAQLDWDRPIVLDSRFRMRMKDLGALLALYSSRRHLPGWVGRLVDEGEVRAEGRVQWEDDTLLIAPFAARNERFGLAARLRLHDHHPAGDLLASWGKASVGVEFDGATRHVHLADAPGWFGRRSELPPVTRGPTHGAPAPGAPVGGASPD